MQGNKILLIVGLLFIFLVLYVFNQIQLAPGAPSKPITILPASLLNETYVQEKVNEYLKDNPNANESLAKDVTYHDIAILEKNISICNLIQDENLKEHCYKSLR